MSANFNIAMLRSIHQPLSESMDAIIAQLTRLLAGQISGNELDQGQHAKLVRGSLEMIGCQAISRLASTLERGCEALALPERRGWDRTRVEQVGRSLLMLAEGLNDQIKHMLEDNEDLPVRLWPVWAHVYEAMGEPVPTADDLFEPDPNFDDEKFQPLAPDYLTQVCQGMSERLGQSLALLDNAHSGSDVAKALREAERVFNWAYGLRHRRGYQAYWLVMRARMAIGLIQDPALLEDKASWTILLNEASIELQKFAKDALRVRPDLLLKVIRPLLTPWPTSWTQAHPALSEMDERMGLSVFWKTVAEVQDQKSQFAVSQFVAHQEELLGTLAAVRAEWSRYLSGEGRASDPAVAKSAMSGALRALSSKRALFADPSAMVMLDALARVGERMPDFTQVSEDMALEFAASVLVVEDSVERRGRVSPEFHEHSKIQQKRLMAAWEGDKQALQALPVVRWDAKKQERQTRQALTAVYQEMRKDLASVEEVLVENFRGEAAKVIEQENMRDTLSLADAVLRMLMCHPASRVVRALVDRLPALASGGMNDPVLQDEITLGITGLTSFLSARESGDEDAENLLAGAIGKLLGEPLRKEADPSMLIPPPLQEVVEQGVPLALVEPLEEVLFESVPAQSDQQEDNGFAFDSPLEDVHHEPLVAAANMGMETVGEDVSAENAIFSEGVVDETAMLIPHAESLSPAEPTLEDILGVSMEPIQSSMKQDEAEPMHDEAPLPGQLSQKLVQGTWDHPSEKEPELVGFLLDEADAVLMEMVLQAGVLEQDPSNEEARHSLRRQFHTIKGSGRIAGVMGLAEVAWWVEHMLLEDEANYSVYRPQVDEVVRLAHEQFEKWFSELRKTNQVWIEAADLRSALDALTLYNETMKVMPPSANAEDRDDEVAVPREPVAALEGFSFDELDGPSLPEEQPTKHEEEAPSWLLQENSGMKTEALDMTQPLPTLEESVDAVIEVEVVSPREEIVAISGAGVFDRELFDVFLLDAQTHCENLITCLEQYHVGQDVDVALLNRASHTLASLSGSMEMDSLRRLARAIEHVLDVNPEDPAPSPRQIPAILAQASEVLVKHIEKACQELVYVPVEEALIDQVSSLIPTVELSEVAPSPNEVSFLPSMEEEAEEDALIDEIIDKMSEVADKLQEATMLLIQLSQRRR